MNAGCRSACRRVSGATLEVMAEQTVSDQDTVRRNAQELWREQNAAFRARVLAQLRTARPRDGQQARPA